MNENLTIMQNEKVTMKANDIEQETGKRLFGVSDVASYLHCGVEEVRALISGGSLISVMPDGSMFRPVDIAAFELGIFSGGLDLTLSSALPSALLIIEDIDAEEFEMIKKIMALVRFTGMKQETAGRRHFMSWRMGKRKERYSMRNHQMKHT